MINFFAGLFIAAILLAALVVYVVIFGIIPFVTEYFCWFKYRDIRAWYEYEQRKLFEHIQDYDFDSKSQKLTDEYNRRMYERDKKLKVIDDKMTLKQYTKSGLIDKSMYLN